jgi:aryl-alcohol dehydrogenase-like predicted oxidoreductase
MKKYCGKLTVKQQILNKISKSRAKVFVPGDFKIITSYPQTLRALKELVQEGKIIKVGHGLYSKAEINQFTKRPRPKFDPMTTAQAVFEKLNIAWRYSSAVTLYNSGQSTQIPVKNFFILEKKREFTRKADYLEGTYVKDDSI